MATQRPRREPAGPSGHVLHMGFLFLLLSLSSWAEIIISVHHDSKVNIPDTSSASYHEAAAKLLSNCSTIEFCLWTSWLSKAKLIWERHLGRREQKGGQEVEAGKAEEVKDAVFNRNPWVTAEETASVAFQSEKQLVCCADWVLLQPCVHAEPGT